MHFEDGPTASSTPKLDRYEVFDPTRPATPALLDSEETDPTLNSNFSFGMAGAELLNMSKHLQFPSPAEESQSMSPSMTFTFDVGTSQLIEGLLPSSTLHLLPPINIRDAEEGSPTGDSPSLSQRASCGHGEASMDLVDMISELEMEIAAEGGSLTSKLRSPSR